MPTQRQPLPVKIAAKPPAAAAVRPDQAAAASASPTAQSKEFCFGVMGAKGLPRYRVKVMGSDFIVKIPDVDVLRFKSFMAISCFLNRHLAKNPEFRSLLPADWKFLPLKQTTRPQQQQVSLVKPPATDSHVPSNKRQNPAAIIIED